MRHIGSSPDAAHDIEEIECNVVLKGLESIGSRDRDRRCISDAGKWFKDKVCTSPIHEPEKDCMPHRYGQSEHFTIPEPQSQSIYEFIVEVLKLSYVLSQHVNI